MQPKMFETRVARLNHTVEQLLNVNMAIVDLENMDIDSIVILLSGFDPNIQEIEGFSLMVAMTTWGRF